MHPFLISLMKIKISILLILSVLINILKAQNRNYPLSGKVTYNNGEPVEMATIMVKGSKLYALTDENGFFFFEKLPLGKIYEIEIKPFDNQPVIVKVNLTKKSHYAAVKLTNSGVTALSEVVVSGKVKGREVKELGFAMNVIATKEASLQNLQTTELLGRSAGIKIRQSAGLGSDMGIYLNGLTGNSIRIFIDGIPVRNYGRSFSISSIPPALIERIEVYKGVLPTELSEDALGGGINIILKKELNNAITTSYSYGSFNTNQWDLNASFRSKKTGFVANFSSFHNYTDNSYKVWGDNVYISDPETGKLKYITATRFHDSYYSSGIRGNAGVVRKKWADELLLGFMFSKMEKETQTGAVMNRVYGSRETFYNSSLGSVQYRKKNIFVKGLNFNTFTTFSRTFRNVVDVDNRVFDWTGNPMKDYKGDDILSPAGQGEAGNATRAENQEINIANRSNIDYKFHKNHTLAASYFFDRFTREIDDPLLPDLARKLLDKRKYQKQIIGINYEAKFFDKKLRTNLFYKFYNQNVELTEVRYTRHPSLGYILNGIPHNRNIEHHGYGLTLSYLILPKVMLVTSAEKAIRLPGINELLGNTSDLISPNYGLLPERSQNLNIGFHLNDFKFRKHLFSAEVNFFVRDINDLIIQGVPREIDNSFSYMNLGKIISRGIDAEFRYSWDKKIFLSSNFSYNKAIYNLEFDPFGVRYFYYKNRLRNQPYLTSNTNVEYILDNFIKKNSRLAVNYNFGYTHQFYLNWESLGSANKIIIPSQPLHDVGVTYTVPNKRWTFALNAKNIFDTQVFDNFALQKPGRSIYGKVTFHFLDSNLF